MVVGLSGRLRLCGWVDGQAAQVLRSSTHALPETSEFHTVLFFPFPFLLKLALADGIEEHDFIFFQGAELIPYKVGSASGRTRNEGAEWVWIERKFADLVYYAPPIALVWLPGDVNDRLPENEGLRLTLLAANFYGVRTHVKTAGAVERRTHTPRPDCVRQRHPLVVVREEGPVRD